MRLRLLSALAVTFAVSAAHATPLLVTESGTFSSSTPISTISAPNGTFSISFNVNSSPAVLSSSTNQFDVMYTSFSYLLNGVVNTASVGSVTFYDSLDSGLFTVCFTAACPANSSSDNSLVFEGAQVYTGTVQTPTLLTGSYAPYQSFPVVNGSPYTFASVANTNIISLAATPEPSSLVLLGTGVFGMVGAVRRRFL